MHKRENVDIIYLNFSPKLELAIGKLEAHGTFESVIRWIGKLLRNRKQRLKYDAFVVLGIVTTL